MKLTSDEFFNLVKVIRMLYGLSIAERFFLKNIETFTGITKKDLQSMIQNAKVNTNDNLKLES